MSSTKVIHSCSALSCVDGVSKDQGVFRIIRNSLAIVEADGAINAHMDEQSMPAHP